MKEPYDEGVANHIGPESCAVARKGLGEALTGVRVGWVLSCERPTNRVPTPWGHVEGNTGDAAFARHRWTRRSLRPHARTEALCAGTGRSHHRPRPDGGEVRKENPMGGRP